MKDNEAFMHALANLQKVQIPAKKTRGSIEICAEILRTCSDGGAKRTHIMYKANLSYTMLTSYVRLLVKCELLQASTVDAKAAFKTTEKGRQFLLHYLCVQQLLTPQ